MGWAEFGILLNDNIYLYLFLLGISAVIYFLLFRKVYITIIDPLMFQLIFSLFGFSVVLFLFFTKNIKGIYFISYMLTQSAFFLGMYSFKQLSKIALLNQISYRKIQSENVLLFIIFIISSGVYLICQLLSYAVIGIPVFMQTHVDIYNGSGGWGVLGKFIDVTKPISIFLIFHFLLKKEKVDFLRIYSFITFLLIAIFSILSGGKGDFMIIGFVFFCYLICNADKYRNIVNNIKKYERWIIVAGVSGVFMVIFFAKQTEGGGINMGTGNASIDIFMFRLVSSGDTYFFAYPNDNIKDIKGDNSFLALFGSVFSTLRIVPRENQPVVLGTQLYRMFIMSDQTAGPNARHNVYGYVYYGFLGSIIFSFLIGLCLSFLRNKYFYKLRTNIIGQIIFTLFYLNIAVIETDPPMAVSNIENFILIFPLILLSTFLVYYIIFRSMKHNQNIIYA